ncbi:hypothetical protein ACFWMR_23815 [Amycolatopsis thailandensis]|uniref:Putative integral membrane protein n=1 Tax=Amycolatopsis azurea DSM 43854 TaxID=1238180 RepID=M2QIY6_9PSEU|nr:hypothetical protein [Amycolatopsis azurea]EMD26676.1 putative integral membrane protein [Amycolatopsis azurea DSM 43854]OOC04539.1 hypothetical protein B0293_22255 [Amycolatopsis azurea DSM 43854]
MQPVVVAYALYLAITVPLTVLVARTLSRHGKTFLEDVFQDKQALAHSVNQLLVVGFYLVSLGFVTLFLTSNDTVLDARDVFEMVSVKVGTVALVLGVMHVGNVLVFNGIRRKHLNHVTPRPAPAPQPYPGYPAPAPHPAP